MESKRTKTYEEFKDEIKDRNFLIVASDIINQLEVYSGAHNHYVRNLSSTLKGWIRLKDRINLEGTIEEVFAREKPNEVLMEAMYGGWKMGTYKI